MLTFSYIQRTYRDCVHININLTKNPILYYICIILSSEWLGDKVLKLKKKDFATFNNNSISKIGDRADTSKNE